MSSVYTHTSQCAYSMLRTPTSTRPQLSISGAPQRGQTASVFAQTSSRQPRLMNTGLQQAVRSPGRPGRGQRTGVTCMAHPRRVARVAKQIEREIGTLLLRDQLLQEAVCPERKRGLDTAVSALASVTEVVISNDLQVAKVYVSVFSDEAGKETAMAGLKRLEGYVRKQIGRLIRLRLTPEIRFLQDDTLQRSERVLELLNRIKKQEQGLVEAPPIAMPSGAAGGDDDMEARYSDWIDLKGVEDDLSDDEDDEEEEGSRLMDVVDDADDEGFFDDDEDEEVSSGVRGPSGGLTAAVVLGQGQQAMAEVPLPPRRAAPGKGRRTGGPKKGSKGRR